MAKLLIQRSHGHTASVREVDVAIVADLGTLARLSPLVGEGRARELALTGRNFDGTEAERIGFATACDDAAATLAAYSPARMESKSSGPRHSPAAISVASVSRNRRASAIALASA